METPKEIKDAMTKALNESETLDNHELVITPAFMDDIEPASTYKGLYVVLGKEVAVRPRKSAPIAPTIDATAEDLSRMMFWFRKRDGRLFHVNEDRAHQLLTMKAEHYNFVAPYVGATTAKDYKNQIVAATKEYDDTDLVEQSALEGDQMNKTDERKLRDNIRKQREIIKAFDEDWAKAANPAIRPRAKELLKVIAQGNDIRGNPHDIVKQNLSV